MTDLAFLVYVQTAILVALQTTLGSNLNTISEFAALELLELQPLFSHLFTE
jgi:hypothetical protein